MSPLCCACLRYISKVFRWKSDYKCKAVIYDGDLFPHVNYKMFEGINNSFTGEKTKGAGILMNFSDMKTTHHYHHSLIKVNCACLELNQNYSSVSNSTPQQITLNTITLKLLMKLDSFTMSYLKTPFLSMNTIYSMCRLEFTSIPGTQLDIVWDRYLENRLKDDTRENRGVGIRRKVSGSTKILVIL